MEPRPAFSRRHPARRRKRSTVTIPERVSPYVKLIFAEMQRQRVIYDDVEEGSGVLRSTLKAWRHKNKPSLDNIEAVLGFLGWEFIPVPRERALPPDVVNELRPIANRLGVEMPAAIELLVAMAAGVHADAAPEAA